MLFTYATARTFAVLLNRVHLQRQISLISKYETATTSQWINKTSFAKETTPLIKEIGRKITRFYSASVTLYYRWYIDIDTFSLLKIIYQFSQCTTQSIPLEINFRHKIDEKFN